MTKSTITRERIQRIIRAIDSEAYDEEEIREWLSSDEIMELSRMALAAMDSETVAWTDEEELRDANESGSGYLFGIGHDANKFADPRRQIMLYRHAQPVPVVLKDHQIRELVNQLRDIAIEYHGTQQLRERIARALRAAMLQAEPVTTANKLGNSPVIPDCWCRTCRPVVLNDMRFVVCPDCGNKRCPRANDHRNSCTWSNVPGQEGSAYPAAPQEVKP
ncbi:hypothetical protein [Klebsiella aerogenes]|uniref:hypothetical protein n=1 Tax=Klebsiella aerogenes TaxID=548 RepID=UPI002175E347|nr:hypothetical protein [Klebsiella aerogenes]UWC45378.1 hypothetical protein M5S98_16925 [Klebsiella aerogenes]